jgi:hypothetical protein
MNRRLLVLALAACGHPHGAAGGDDDTLPSDATIGDTAATDGAGGDGDTGGGPGPIPLVACGTPVEVDPALPVAWSFDALASDIPAPWLLTGDTARLFYDSTSQVMTAAHGSATTAAWPSSLAGATFVAGQRSASGAEGVVFLAANQPMFVRVTGGVFGAPVAVPCDPSTFLPTCSVRVAGDGHLWVRSGQHLFECDGRDERTLGRHHVAAEKPRLGELARARRTHDERRQRVWRDRDLGAAAERAIADAQRDAVVEAARREHRAHVLDAQPQRVVATARDPAHVAGEVDQRVVDGRVPPGDGRVQIRRARVLPQARGRARVDADELDDLELAARPVVGEAAALAVLHVADLRAVAERDHVTPPARTATVERRLEEAALAPPYRAAAQRARARRRRARRCRATARARGARRRARRHRLHPRSSGAARR